MISSGIIILVVALLAFGWVYLLFENPSMALRIAGGLFSVIIVLFKGLFNAFLWIFEKIFGKKR